MRSLMLLAFSLSLVATGRAALSSDYESVKRQAEQLYAEQSFAKAHQLYAEVNITNLPTAEQRWVRFRRADTQWRSAAATEQPDNTPIEDARRELESIIRAVARDEDRDRLWAEAEESLGDSFWSARGRDWGDAWPHYEKALDWWAGAPDIETARHRYLGMVWRMARMPGPGPLQYGYWGNSIPLEILDNALRIAQSAEDKARAHYYIAMLLRNRGGTWQEQARVPEEFEAAIQIGKESDWYDDALFTYAEWMSNQGRIVPLENGGWGSQPDYVRALALFRQLLSEFKKGETRYWEVASRYVQQITSPQLGVSVESVFLPDSEIRYALNWRNVSEIHLALYPVELHRDVNLPLDSGEQADWLASINLAGREKIRSWTVDTLRRGREAALTSAGDGLRPTSALAEAKDDHRPGSEQLRLDGKLAPGAYVIEASAGGQSARDLILVTDNAAVLKLSGKQALVFVCNALNGSPRASAQVKLWETWYAGRRWHSRVYDATANADGIALFELNPAHHQHRQLFVSTVHDDRQAFSHGQAAWNRPDAERWKIYAFTDRPAYRPKEAVQWKFTARQYNGSEYFTPAGATIEFDIMDPRGAPVKSDRVRLNAFGSAWGSLELTDEMTLGEYRVTFWDEGKKQRIGQATLFRLEEYKLPEFRVSVQTPEADGKKKAFRLGEQVEVNIQADYYFGGPVSDAAIEVLVRQQPYFHWWHEPRRFDWYYEDMASPYGHYGGSQIVKREVITTDARGQARLTFDTPANAGQDFEYIIEARVTDASRREISGSSNVRVTRQRYYVHPKADHNLYRPQDKVRVEFKALDANEQPVQVEGAVKVTRDYWFEIWLAPDGSEIKGDDLKRLQSQHTTWPPPPSRPDQKPWRLKFRGYEHDDVLTRTLKADTNGQADLVFTPEREGYYRVSWTSAATSLTTNHALRVTHHASPTIPLEPPINAETMVWVCTSATTDLGYRHGGVEIIADKDTFRVGQSAPVMLVAPASDRYVLFCVEGEELYDYQLVHMQGTVKLIELPIQERHVPNVFLGAALVADRQIFTDTKQIVVPPTKNFLSVDVKSDREQYLPQQEGALTITTTDDQGRPVSAEVSLGLVDESVYYIQTDYAGDPRKFFFGEKREQQIQTLATMNYKPYAKLVEWTDDWPPGNELRLIDETDRQRIIEGQQYGYFAGRGQATGTRFGSRGGVGGLADSMLEAAAMAPAPSGMQDGLHLTPYSKGARAEVKDLALGQTARIDPATGGLPAGEAEPAVQVRSDFRSSIFWQPDLKTDHNGRASVQVKYPDSLTSWKATARAVTAANQFGMADATTRTRQPLIVRLQGPRFFVVGDTATISAVVNNNTDQALEVRVAFGATNRVATSSRGGQNVRNILLPASGSSADWKTVSLRIPANGEVRADWTVTVRNPGEVKLNVVGRSPVYADAMEKTFTAYEHGIEKLLARSGKVQAGDAAVQVILPRERKPESTSLIVQVTPSLAVTMLDALPYLINYPYGCTEQTMSRFLPATITARTLRDLGLQPEDIMGRVFGGIETNFATATHPAGKRNLSELDAMTEASLHRLYEFQHQDGGWGWWKEGESDRWMTAYVVWGLTLANEAGAGIELDVLDRGISYLDKALVEAEREFDIQAFMLHALSANHAQRTGAARVPSKFQVAAFDNLWNNRDQLNAYTRALLALSAHHFGNDRQARILVGNLENGVLRDARPDQSVLAANVQQPTTPGQQPTTNGKVLETAHWGEDGVYWRWSEGGVESTAFGLRALLAIDPTNKLVEPAANWLIKNRRGAQWNSTRDTAIVVLALDDYLRASGELKADLDYELVVNGKSIATKKLSGADVFSAPSRFAIDPQWIRDNNDIRILRKRGDAPIYFAVESRFFSTEEPITPAGNELFLRRDYFKLVGRPTLLKGYVYDEQPLRDGQSVKSGERVQAVLIIEAKNHYEYLMFEDLKPAGLEAAEVRSGGWVSAHELKSGAAARAGGNAAGGSDANRMENLIDNSQRSTADYTGRLRQAYPELRDRKVALFIDKLPQGIWEIRYDFRAEVPGQFHALPVVGQGMYVPEIRCNGAEIRLQVQE